MVKYLIIDDHVLIRTGIKFLLFEKYKPDEIHEAFDGESAIEQINYNHYDLVIMDIQMPNTDTLVLMEFIKKEYPLLKLLIYSMSSEKIYAKRFMRSGAMGFLSKDAPLEEITRAIDTVLTGKRYISESIAETLAEDSYAGKPENPFDDLSKREFQIAKLLLSGQTLTEISQELNIQTSTVGTHKQRLFEKLAVTNLLELKEIATSFNL
ncbi:MAG: response regulator transcription factor [Ferruginibacter sp.]